MRRRLDLRLKFLSRRIQRNAVCADRNNIKCGQEITVKTNILISIYSDTGFFFLYNTPALNACKVSASVILVCCISVE